MVYYKDTLEVCHPLTELGKERYEAFLEEAGDEILYRAEHPVYWFL